MTDSAPTLPAARGALPPEGAAPLLDVKDLRVAFGGREVVHGITFQIHAGEHLPPVGREAQIVDGEREDRHRSLQPKRRIAHCRST